MSRGLLPPELGREVETLKIRVSRLEKLLRDLLEQRPPETIYSLPGPVYVTESNRWYPRRDEKVIEILVSLVEAGGSPTVVEIWKNDLLEREITLETGQGETSPIVVNAAIELQRNEDDLRVAITAAGANAVGLNVQVRCK